MNELTKDSLSKEIFHKIKLFSSEKYFKLFAYILTQKSKNFSAFEKISSLALSIDNFKNEKDNKKFKELYRTNNEVKKDKFSFWFYLMTYICNIKSKKKLIKFGKNELGMDPMIYTYMVNYCQNKVKLLNNLSIRHNLNLNNVVKFYLDICSYNILLIKEIKSKYEENNFNNYLINYNNHNYARRKTGTNTNINLRLQKNNQTAKKNAKLSTYLESKSLNGKKKINYSNSFTRLFIGETDQKSVEERHISNIFLKNFCDLKLFNKKINIASLYLKKLYKKLSKKKEIIIDSGMNHILNKFKLDSKLVETYQKKALSSDKKEKNNKNYFKNNTSDYIKPFLNNRKLTFDKISKFSGDTPQNEYLIKLKNSRDKLNINIKKHLSRNSDFDFSSDFYRGFSQQYSRNISSNFRNFRMSVTNNTKNNSAINTRYSNNNIKINLKNTYISGFRLRNRRNKSNNNSDILINIKTKLNNENTHRFNINPKKYQIKSSLSNELSFE